MFLAELTPTQRELQQQHIERRLRIAAAARIDRPINLKFKNGITPLIPIVHIKYPEEIFCGRLWASVEPWGAMMKETPLKCESLVPLTSQHLVHRIIELVCIGESVSKVHILSIRQTRSISFPRQIAFYLAAKTTSYSLPQIAKCFGRDHTTILYGRDKITHLRVPGSQLDQRLSWYERQLSARSI